MKELYLIPKHLYGIMKPSSAVKKIQDDVKCGNVKDVNTSAIKRTKPNNETKTIGPLYPSHVPLFSSSTEDEKENYEEYDCFDCKYNHTNTES